MLGKLTDKQFAIDLCCLSLASRVRVLSAYAKHIKRLHDIIASQTHITIDDAARLRDVHSCTIKEWLRGGKLKVAGRRGRIVLLDRDEVLHVKRQKHSGPP